MPTKPKKTKEYSINMEQSNWTLKIERDDDGIFLSLHWGDKMTATHYAELDTEDFRNMMKDLLDD